MFNPRHLRIYFRYIAATGGIFLTTLQGALYVNAATRPNLTPLPQEPKVGDVLTLENAIQKALISNRDMRKARLSYEAAKLSFADASDRMFMPSISLAANSSSNFTLYQVPGTQAATVGAADRSHGYPSASAGVVLGSYTLFNFWKDWTAYEIAKLNFHVTTLNYNEVIRRLRFQVMNEYFKCRTEQDKLDAAKRSVEISEAIVEVVKSRVNIGKATDRDVSSSVVDLLGAKNQLNTTTQSVRAEFANLNLLLADPAEKALRLQSEMKYVLLKISPPEALKLFKERGPTLIAAINALKVSESTVELEEKNRLPLPTIKFSGVTVGYASGYYGSEASRTTTGAQSGNFDVSAAISLTLPLVGPGGLFNSRLVEIARMNRDAAEITLRDTQIQGESFILSTIDSIRQQEENIANLKDAFQKSEELLNSLLTQDANAVVSRLELRDAINATRLNEFTLKDSILAHLNTKLQLATTLGVDALPGDSYQ